MGISISGASCLIIPRTDIFEILHYAGHIENGFDSVSDPHIGTSD
jgi:hypothetical protein